MTEPEWENPADHLKDENWENANGYLELLIYPILCPVMKTLKGKYYLTGTQLETLNEWNSHIMRDIKKAIVIWDVPDYLISTKENTPQIWDVLDIN